MFFLFPRNVSANISFMIINGHNTPAVLYFCLIYTKFFQILYKSKNVQARPYIFWDLGRGLIVCLENLCVCVYV